MQGVPAPPSILQASSKAEDTKKTPKNTLITLQNGADSLIREDPECFTVPPCGSRWLIFNPVKIIFWSIVVVICRIVKTVSGSQ